MRWVLDTNVVISAIAWGGLPKQIFTAATAELVTLYTSPKLIEELRDVIHRPHIIKALAKHGTDPNAAITYYQNLTISVSPLATPRVVPNDIDDDHVIAAALAARANIIVSGDSDLLSLGSHQGAKILTPAMALHQLSPAST